MKHISEQFKVSATQWVKGLVLFVVPTILTTLIQMLQGNQVIDLALILNNSLIGALTYIGYSFTQDSKGVPLGGADKK